MSVHISINKVSTLHRFLVKNRQENFFIAVILLVGNIYCERMLYGADQTAEKMHKKVEILIDRLASKNNAPTIDSKAREIDFPAGYTDSAQEDVFAAWKELKEVGSASFSELISHLDDNRYSYTYKTQSGDKYINIKVSDVCVDFLSSQINVYMPLVRPDYNGYKIAFFPDSIYPEQPLKWFTKRKDKTLWKLQLEAARWAVKEEKERGLKSHDVDPDYQPFGQRIVGTQEELERTLFGLEIMIKLLEESQKPISMMDIKPPHMIFHSPRGNIRNHKKEN